jgi:hypothetical protein
MESSKWVQSTEKAFSPQSEKENDKNEKSVSVQLSSQTTEVTSSFRKRELPEDVLITLHQLKFSFVVVLIFSFFFIIQSVVTVEEPPQKKQKVETKLPKDQLSGSTETLTDPSQQPSTGTDVKS